MESLESNSEYKYMSGIFGSAQVLFGGKVVINSGMTENFHLPAISLAELYEQVDPGRKLTDADRKHEPQVWLVFNDMRSIDILQHHLDYCRELLKREAEQEPKPEPAGLLAMKVTDIDFSVRVLTAFKKNGINTVADLVRLHKKDLLTWWQFGKKSRREVDDFIEDNGLQWGMEV